MVPGPLAPWKARGKFLPLLVASALLACTLREGRALWVVRFRLASPESIDRVVQEAKEGHLNALFAQVYGRADAYWNSAFVPRSEVLQQSPEDFDPLGYLLQRARGLGLQVHAWLNVYYVWPYPPPFPSSPHHVVNLHPDWLILDEEGRSLLDYSPDERRQDPIEGLFLDPANPGVRDYFLRVLEEVLQQYPVDGVHLDFVRYPGPKWGFNPRALEAFKGRWGVDPRCLDPLSRKPNPWILLREDLPLLTLWNYYYQSLWAEERSYHVTRLVAEASRLLKAKRPGAILSAAVLPDPDRAYFERGQDWGRWLEAGYLDLVVPMAYGGDLCRVEAQLRAARERAQGRMVFAGLGAWRKPPQVVAQEVRRLRRLGVQGFSYFSYQGMKDQRPDYLSFLGREVHRRRADWPRGRGGGERGHESPDPFLCLLRKQSFLLGEFKRRKRALEERLRRLEPLFHYITRELYPKALPSEDEEVLIPPRVELEALSLYVHPRDCPSSRKKAFYRLLEARRRIEAGEGFHRVAKGLNGLRRETLFLRKGSELAPLLWGMADGEVSPVLEVRGSYVLYRVLKHHPPERRPYGDLPWSLKRLVLQERLRSLMEKELGWLLQSSAGSQPR